MKKISLSSILLFCLVIPFIMTYRIGPGETPYWFFGIIFALLTSYLIFDKLKSLIFWLLIILVIGSAFYSAIVVRHQTAPAYQVHDIILQQEAAIRFLLEGKNPYATTYFNTPLELWHYSDTEVNPALFHFVMIPGYLLISLPFYFLSISLFGFYDGRMPQITLFAFLLILAWRLLKGTNENRRLFITLLAFNPATLGYFLEGRSDIFVFAFLFWSWYLLEKKRFAFSGIPMALAFAIKQSAWPIFPFYLAFLWLNQPNLKKFLVNLLPFIIVFGIIVLPFFFWDKTAFIRSTILYLNGNTEHSYPISGYGWGMVLHQLGVIGDIHDYYPFLVWQIVACLPLGIILLRWLRNSTTVYRLIFSYGIFTMVFWYFSRYFNNSHLGYLSTVFIAAYFWTKNEKV